MVFGVSYFSVFSLFFSLLRFSFNESIIALNYRSTSCLIAG
ncbi:MAG: hypothetical protein ACD_39C00740G0002 [uncultured bacterium]|nr:MAG: hypothetical protein ACD_39C00740G0002 [uncultured bacterium]